MMKFDKEKFLKTDFGEELELTIRCWDDALEKRRKARCNYDKEYGCWDRICQSYQDKWEVFKLAIQQFFGITYNFTRTDEHFGLVTEDEKDWLLKVERESESGGVEDD